MLLLPYPVRSRVYCAAQRTTEEQILVEAASKVARQELRRVLKRVVRVEDRKAAKETMGPFARTVGKLAATCPLVVCEVLLEQVGLRVLRGFRWGAGAFWG